MAKKKKGRSSALTVRRDAVRDARKRARDLETLAKMARGGAPDRPIEVVSASLVEPHARGAPCPLCGGELRLLEHAAESIEGVALRVARVACARCGVTRSIYFRIGSALPN